MPTSEAQKRAKNKWVAKNRDQYLQKQNEYTKKYYIENIEERREYGKLYYLKRKAAKLMKELDELENGKTDSEDSE